MAKTANQLLTGLKSRGIVPSSQVTLTDENLLSMADSVISGVLVPALVSTRQNYLVKWTDEPLVANTAKYSIPPRAVARSLRDLKFKFSTGGLRDMAEIALEDAHLFQNSDTPSAYYFDEDWIVVVPTPGSSVSGQGLRIFWECPPSELITTDQAATIASSTTSSVTVGSVPGNLTAGDTVDIIRGKSGHSITHLDLVIDSIASNVINFTTSDLDTSIISSGDYVAEAGKSPVIQLPNELYRVLETMTAKTFLYAIGDGESASGLEDDGEGELEMALKLLQPRNRGENTVIINRNSLLRGNKGRYRRGLIF